MKCRYLLVAKAKKRLKKNVKYTLCAGGVIVAVAGIISVCSALSNTKPEETAKTTTSPYLSDSDVQEIIDNAVSTFLNMGDFKISQGEQIVITTNTAAGSENLIYTSSDESVVYIEQDGTLTAVGVGIAAITVTNGNISDSIVVEVTENDEDEGEHELPHYSQAQRPENSTSQSPVQKPTGSIQSTSQQGNENVTQSESQSITQEQSTTVYPTGQQGTTRPTQGQSQSGNQGGNNGTTQHQTQSQNQSTSQGITRPSQTQTTTAASKVEPLNSSDLYGRLEKLGFKKKVSNCFVFELNGEYAGQIILESKCVHIYMKEKTPEYEKALLEVLKLTLPSGYENVYNRFVTTAQDTALKCDEKKVQIVVSRNDEHRQLIIYN